MESKEYLNETQNNEAFKVRTEKGNLKHTTLYGEFIPSYDAWITPDNQREIVSHLEDITDSK